MQLIEKYAQQLLAFKDNKTLMDILSGIEIVEVDELHDGLDPANTIAVGPGLPTPMILNILSDYALQHFVQTTRKDFFYDLFASCLMLKQPQKFINNPRPFFLKGFNLFKKTGIGMSAEEYTLGASSQKEEVLDKIEAFLSAGDQVKNHTESVLVIADELIMNGFFNAPIDKAGNHPFMNLHRGQKLNLPTNRKLNVFVAYDWRQLLIGCEDPFGSVNRDKLLQQLIYVFDRDDQAPIRSPETIGSTGLGCKMMIEKSTGFYVVVKERERTLVCCSLPLGIGRSNIEEMPKNLHFSFSEKDA